MDGNINSQKDHSSNNDGPFIGKKSLKAMLDQSEDILRKNGGPSFLKRQEVIEVKTGASESELIKVQQIHALKELINTIPGQMQRHEEKIQDLMQEVHLVLASMKAQQHPPQLPPPINLSHKWSSKLANVSALSILLLALTLGSFSLGRMWNNAGPSNTSLKTGPITNSEFSLRPRTNLRSGPSLQTKIIIMAKQPTKALAIQSQGEWTQVLLNRPSETQNIVGWVHQSNLLPSPARL